MHKFLIILATGLGTGYAKIVPGTFGTIPAIPLIFLTNKFSILTKLLIFILLFVGGIISAEYYEKYYDKKDPSEVVIDEIAAYYLMLMFIPLTTANLLLSFVLFRIFDITKPYPIRNAESVGGGVGIMIDDILAIFYALAVFFIIRIFV
jgi:phosphatidylglycerophosphatase A